MKLQAIIGRRSGKVEKDDIYEIEGCAQSSLTRPDSQFEYLLHIKGFNTNSEKVGKNKRRDNGKNLYIEITSPFFRDITRFYEELLDLSELGLDFCIIDSKLSEEKYDNEKFRFPFEEICKIEPLMYEEEFFED